ncbi:MAG: RidA family protein [Hyphomicrobiales bacterium]|nr:RidA family protein [Hyphomicrobiales bacterium]
MTETAEARLAALGLTLPEPVAAVANYVPTLISGKLLYVSGQISMEPDGPLKGKLGDDLGIEDGQKAARVCCLNILAQARSALGSLEEIGQTIRLTGFVNATPDFTDHPKVINGASDLMVDVLGERGRHTRAAVGVAGLPLGVAVEIDAIFAIA